MKKQESSHRVERGQGLVEYALVLVIVVLVVIFGGRWIEGRWDNYQAGKESEVTTTDPETDVIVEKINEELNIEDWSTPQVVPSGDPYRRVFIDSPFEVFQNNCGGNAEVSNTVERSQTIIYEVEVGDEVEISITGEVSLPVVGKVEIGTALGQFYGITYGTEDELTRSLTVSAEGKTNVIHTLQKVEYWEEGELVWSSGDAKVTYPYRFRKDFGIELIESVEQECE